MKDRPLSQKNPDLRRQVQMPGPEIEVVEQSLHDLIHPEDFRPIRNSLQIPEKLRRDRLLTLPVMYYLTNVLDPSQLPARQVCDLYRRRWRIEDAFAITKRLLGLAYVWVGNRNGISIQIYATWIFYAVVNDLCAEVAIAMNQPLERISLEMVFRSLYHFNSFSERTPDADVVEYLSTNAKILGILKSERTRHRERDALSVQIWGDSASLS
jgi:Transposase DDE domain